jgi:hypothetical protein
LLCESIIDAADRAYHLHTREKRLDLLEQFYQHWNLTTEEKRQAWRSRYDLTQEQLELLATRKLRIEKVQTATWGHQLNLTFSNAKDS